MLQRWNGLRSFLFVDLSVSHFKASKAEVVAASVNTVQLKLKRT